MKPYVFSVPHLNEKIINEFKQIENNDTISPKGQGSENVGLMCGLLAALMIGYLLFGILLITGASSGIGYIAYALSAPVWGIGLIIVVVLSLIASGNKNPAFTPVAVVVDILIGLFLAIIMFSFFGILCMLLIFAIAYNLYQGSRSRMRSVLPNDPGPYNALIVDNNKDELLLENLNNNQLCCVDELCEMLKKLNK